MLKRSFDLVASGIGIFLLAPLFFIVAFWIKVDSPGPIFFRQERVGRNGIFFRIYKFRSMTVNAESKGLQITVGKDNRVTRPGSFLRKSKIDELPQLLNVFIGEMSLVGPRPEVPKYMNKYPVDIRNVVLSVKPGITDWASIKYKDENIILAQSTDPEFAYINDVLPVKQKYYVDYVNNQSFFEDIKIILMTFLAVLHRR